MASFSEKCLPLLGQWKFFFAIIWPLILTPLLILGEGTGTSRCAYAVGILAGFWMTEALPIPITSLMPMVLYPLLGIQSSNILAHEYLKDSILIFVGGLIIALAFEYCGLHKRVALRVILCTGTSLKMLMLGIMLCTMVLSMWMSNTAVAAMMVPIIMAVLEELERCLVELHNKDASKTGRASVGQINPSFECGEEELGGAPGDASRGSGESRISNIEMEDILRNRRESCMKEVGISSEDIIQETQIDNVDTNEDSSLKNDKKFMAFMSNVRTMFLLSCAYSANIGGTGVITGSGTNLVAVEFLGDLDPKHHGDYAALTFTTWMAFNIIPMSLNIAVAWIYLQLSFIGIPEKLKFWKVFSRKKGEDGAVSLLITPAIEKKIAEMLRQTYEKLGPVTTHEKGVGICFLTAVFLWIAHDPKFIPGWSNLFPKKVSIATAGLAISTIFFLIPRNPEFYAAFSKRDFTGVQFKPLLDWSFIQKKFPWGVVILLGGGYAMSNGAKKSGLSAWVGQSLKALSVLPPHGILAVLCVLIGFLTEIASNTATATIVLPILLELSKELNIHPLYLTLPATIVCSYAFMLPVATPPNAIVYAASDMKVIDMIKTGFFMNCSCVFILYVSTILYGNLLFHFSEYNYVP